LATYAYELTGSISNLVSDLEIIFPNVLTCVAVVGYVRGALVGAHVTLADRTRLSQVASVMRSRYGTPSQLYVVGPIGSYNVSSFANFGAPVRVSDMPGGIDVRATLNQGLVEFAKRPAGAGGFEPILDSAFTS